MSRPKGLPKTGGRKAGVQNKPKVPNLRKMMEEKLQAEAEATVAKMSPLEFALQCMRDPSYPPGFRLEACKVAMPYVHSKCADQPSEQVQQITEIRRIIVSPRDVEVDEHGNATVVNEGYYANGDRVEPADPAEYKAAADEANASRDAPAVPDPLAVARSRLDRIRGVH
jgi:hypothetical protein